jgi:hypothetical protein
LKSSQDNTGKEDWADRMSKVASDGLHTLRNRRFCLGYALFAWKIAIG